MPDRWLVYLWLLLTSRRMARVWPYLECSVDKHTGVIATEWYLIHIFILFIHIMHYFWAAGVLFEALTSRCFWRLSGNCRCSKDKIIYNLFYSLDVRAGNHCDTVNCLYCSNECDFICSGSRVDLLASRGWNDFTVQRIQYVRADTETNYIDGWLQSFLVKISHRLSLYF